MKHTKLLFSGLFLFMVLHITSCKKGKKDQSSGGTPVLMVSTLAGNGTAAYKDAADTNARFNGPNGVAVDAQGTVFVADQGNSCIRKITAAGVVTTLAGSSPAGFADGAGTAAKFNLPVRLALDAQGNVYVSDELNHRIRKVSPAGLVTTLAGNGTPGYADGQGTSARFSYPTGVAVDAQGNVYVSDQANNCIRKITPAGTVSTFAGSNAGGYADGTGNSARFAGPTDVAADAQGNLYVADNSNHRIRKITPAQVVTTLAGNGVSGYMDGPAATAEFGSNPPQALRLAVDTKGMVFVVDQGFQRIRKIDLNGTVTTYAGTGVQGFADGAAASAQFSNPGGVAADAKGNVYIGDFANHRIRKIYTQYITSR